MPQSSRELAFSKGDFFHVVGSENDKYWYEACNPATNMRGLVPVDYFEVIGKTVGSTSSLALLNATMGEMNLNDQTPRGSNGYGNGMAAHASASAQKTSPVYGVVQYDFVAEQKDELNVKAGESVIVIAQSNHEWVVCKPIGRLGGPGLIPISFIEIRDVATGRPVENTEEFISKSGVPKVDEWKQKLGEYKSKSIPLGQFEFNNTTPNGPQSISPSRQSQQRGPPLSPLNSPTTATALLPVKEARVEQCSYSIGQYWYWVRATMEDGRQRNLCRYYEDFYDFQITLLSTFPVEAGSTARDRIIPFIPGKAKYVTDAIAEERKEDLDQYVRELCALPAYIKDHELVKSFFAPREGDVESSVPTNMAPQPSMRDIGRASQLSQSQASLNRTSNQTSQSVSSRSSSSQRAQPAAQIDSSIGAGTFPSIGRSDSQTDLKRKDNYMSFPLDSHESSYPARQSTPFIKIKIFFQDDIIVIRTPPDVSYDDLMEKMTERLGNAFRSVRYRDSLSGDMYDITNDGQLAAAIQSTEKLVLIAD